MGYLYAIVNDADNDTAPVVALVPDWLDVDVVLVARVGTGVFGVEKPLVFPDRIVVTFVAERKVRF